jgi:hypothetical protein
MRSHVLRAIVAIAVWGTIGCAVTVPPPGEPVYEPPVAVEEPPVSVYVWWPWPHYEVEHHYVVENRDRVVIQDRHYFPTYGRSRRYIRNDAGNHRGWYKHER